MYPREAKNLISDVQFCRAIVPSPALVQATLVSYSPHVGQDLA